MCLEIMPLELYILFSKYILIYYFNIDGRLIIFKWFIFLLIPWAVQISIVYVKKKMITLMKTYNLFTFRINMTYTTNTSRYIYICVICIYIFIHAYILVYYIYIPTYLYTYTFINIYACVERHFIRHVFQLHETMTKFQRYDISLHNNNDTSYCDLLVAYYDYLCHVFLV